MLKTAFELCEVLIQRQMFRINLLAEYFLRGTSFFSPLVPVVLSTVKALWACVGVCAWVCVPGYM